MGGSIGDLTPENVQQILGSDGSTKVDVDTLSGVNRLRTDAIITGQVTVVPPTDHRVFFGHLENNGSDSLKVNGSTTPVTFTFDTQSEGGVILYITRIILVSHSSSVKMEKFLGTNVELTNGLRISVTSNGVTDVLSNLKNTSDIKHEFTLGMVSEFSITYQTSLDDLTATMFLGSPLLLYPGTGDNITALVRDNLNVSAVSKLEIAVVGYTHGS